MIAAIRKNENAINNYRDLYTPEQKIDLSWNKTVNLNRQIAWNSIETILDWKISKEILEKYIKNSDSYNSFSSRIKSNWENWITIRELEVYAQLKWNKYHNDTFGTAWLDYTNPESIKQHFNTEWRPLDFDWKKVWLALRKWYLSNISDTIYP